MGRLLLIAFIVLVAIDYFVYGGHYMKEAELFLKPYGRQLYSYINGTLNPWK